MSNSVRLIRKDAPVYLGRTIFAESEHSLYLGTFCSFLLSILRPPKSVKMSRAPVSEADKYIKYKETARVRLKSLCFQLNGPYERDRENTERLKSIFRKECLWLDASNYVPAGIEEQVLLAAIRLGIAAGQLTEYPPGGYSCLQNPWRELPSSGCPTNFWLQRRAIGD